MEHSPSQYRSYLLRLWCSGYGKTWRVMVEEVGSHETHYFADLEELCAFLREQTEPGSSPPSNDGIARLNR